VRLISTGGIFQNVSDANGVDSCHNDPGLVRVFARCNGWIDRNDDAR